MLGDRNHPLFEEVLFCSKFHEYLGRLSLTQGWQEVESLDREVRGKLLTTDGGFWENGRVKISIAPQALRLNVPFCV